MQKSTQLMTKEEFYELYDELPKEARAALALALKLCAGLK